MTTQEGSRSCELCGTRRPRQGRCPGCGDRPGGRELRLLPPAAPDSQSEAAAPVRLVRKLKMPTVEELSLAGSGSAGDLRDAMQAVESAIGAGDLAAADDQLERALGHVLASRGDDEEGRRFNFVATLLWMWSAILLGLFLLSLL